MAGKGEPKSGGRKKGTPNKRTLELQALACSQMVSTEGGTTIAPLDVMLETMQMLWQKAQEYDAKDPDGFDSRIGWMAKACQIAEKCAPYKHPRLTSTEVTGPNKGPLQVQELPPDVEIARTILHTITEAAHEAKQETRH